MYYHVLPFESGPTSSKKSATADGTINHSAIANILLAYMIIVN